MPYCSHRFQMPRKSGERELKVISRPVARGRAHDDVLDVARCPLCGHHLIARQDCRGPYFFCLCVKHRAA
jgi:DNA-directed RNA polymerase subunit RPC12/RpoP